MPRGAAMAGMLYSLVHTGKDKMHEGILFVVVHWVGVETAIVLEANGLRLRRKRR